MNIYGFVQLVSTVFVPPHPSLQKEQRSLSWLFFINRLWNKSGQDFCYQQHKALFKMCGFLSVVFVCLVVVVLLHTFFRQVCVVVLCRTMHQYRRPLSHTASNRTHRSRTHSPSHILPVDCRSTIERRCTVLDCVSVVPSKCCTERKGGANKQER